MPRSRKLRGAEAQAVFDSLTPGEMRTFKRIVKEHVPKGGQIGSAIWSSLCSMIVGARPKRGAIAKPVIKNAASAVMKSGVVKKIASSGVVKALGKETLKTAAKKSAKVLAPIALTGAIDAGSAIHDKLKRKAAKMDGEPVKFTEPRRTNKKKVPPRKVKEQVYQSSDVPHRQNMFGSGLRPTGSDMTYGGGCTQCGGGTTKGKKKRGRPCGSKNKKKK